VHACLLLARSGAGFRPGPPDDRAQISTPDDAVALLRPLFDGQDRECGVLLALDTRHRVIATTVVSIGTAAHTFLAPREVFRDALLSGASAIVVAHNHPSGDADPSDDDRRITRRLADAGATMGIELLDHLVLGDPGWTSMNRLGVC
jgi:DNA repair protein RadC